MAGEENLLLNEPPRDGPSPGGRPRASRTSLVIPMTATDIEMRASAGRAVMMYAINAPPKVFQGVNLNRISLGGRDVKSHREVEYGYSSAFTPALCPIRPRSARCLPQEEIDALGWG